jgi:formate dehydrogenase iron-sulfur subunit
VTRPALADDREVGKITLLNRKALEAYQHLEFETAMRLLNEALDQSERAGLTQHPIRARTFVTLGIISLGGFRQRDQAVKYFRKALQIQPEVRLSPGLANPDIQAAFDEAIAGLSTPGGEDLPPEKALLSFRTGTAATGDGQKPWAIRRQQCMHCLNPACVSVCPVAAMYKTAEGPVIYRDERCLGCRYCMNACPFGVPTFDWESGLLDQALIRKCDFCADRQKEGKLPACIEACPTKAVIFGDREALLAEAKERIRQHPEQYVDHIYGETEAGGTSFLMIAGVPFEQLGLPSPGHKALTKLPEKVMGAVVPVALVWAATLSGVTWVVNRRQQLGNHEQAAHSTEKEAKRP